MNSIKFEDILTLGQLVESGYQPKSIKQELRDNLIQNLDSEHDPFEGIMGFEDTVIPDMERALLSKHNILLLGLRGQAKTRLARLMVNLLDEYIPVVEGSEINDDPLRPISRQAKDKIIEMGNATPINWMHRSERYVEKLATPDVTIADLIGDVDPIKAASLRLPYSDERVIHFGLIPRAHRSIFVINELPDLQARIQVSLFNILQEGDLQIRGFKLRLPLDIQFVFTANPEDYTNRGSIVTPLKDRIESQILTHYPNTLEIAKSITHKEANISEGPKRNIHVPEEIKDILEYISFEARNNEYIDEKSGVSARVSISSFENLISTAERRMVLNKEDTTQVRISDFWGIIPSITGKLELVYEGEQEGPLQVAINLIALAIHKKFLEIFPDPDCALKLESKDPYGTIRAWFSAGNQLDLFNDDSDKVFTKKLESIHGTSRLFKSLASSNSNTTLMAELLLHGMAESDVISKNLLQTGIHFSDPLASMFDDFE